MDRYYNIVNYVHGYSIQFLYCLASCASLVKMRTSINVCGMSEKMVLCYTLLGGEDSVQRVMELEKKNTKILIEEIINALITRGFLFGLTVTRRL